MSVMSDLLENNTPSESPYYEGGGTPGRGDPGFFGSILNNVASGLEGVVGGGLDYVGANLNRLDEDGRASSYVESIRNGGKTGLGKLGDWLINNGEYLNNDAARRNQSSGTLDKYQDETVLQRLTDLGYLTDSRGLLADVSNMGGSAVPFAVASLAIPGSGVAAKAARGAGGLFERAGMGTLGRAVASEEGQSAAGAAARWALGGGTLEPVTNAGSMYSDLKSQGLSDNEIARHMNSAAYEELPIDMLTQGVLGPILEGKALAPLAKTGGRIRRGAIRGLNIPGAASSEYVQEMTQQQVQNKWTGQPYGTLLNPTEDEQQAGRAAFMGTLPLGLFGAARGAFRKRKGSTSDMRDNSAMNSAVTSQQDNMAADRSNDPTNPFAGQPKVLGSAPSIQTEQVLSSSQMPSGDAGKEAFFNAISGQESGGDYNAENGNSGAFGKYQIMPDNWPSWAEEAGIGSDAEQTPENQETVAKFKLGQLYDTYGPEGAMVAWYAGDANAQRYVNGDSTDIWGRAWNEPQSNGPSIQSYVDDVMGKIGSAPQQNQSSSVPTYDLPTQGDSITEQITHLKPDFQQALPIIGGMLNQAGLAEGAQISSAARTPEHNAEVGGVENSYHIDHGDGGDAVDIVLPDGTTDQQAQAVLQMFKDTGAFQEVLFHDVGSGYHLHLGGYNGGLDGSNAASNAAKAAPPKLDLSKLDLTPEQQAQNQAAAEALVSSGQVSPEQQAAVMQMAQSMVMVPTDNSAEKDIARANVLQQAVDNNDLKTVYNMLPQQTVQAVASTMAPNNRTNITASGAPTASRISVDQLDPKKFSPVDRVSYALHNGDYVGAAKVAESIGDNNTAKLFLRAVNNPDIADQIQSQLQKGLNFSSPDRIQSNAMIQQNDTMQNTMSNPSDAAPVAVDDQQQGNTPIHTPVQFKPVTPAQAETQQYQPNKQVKVVAQQPSRENGAFSIPESTAAQAVALSDNTDRIADRMNELNTMSTNDRVSLGKKLLKQMVTDGESMGETFKDELSRGGRKAIAKAEERIEMRDHYNEKEAVPISNTNTEKVRPDEQSNLTYTEKLFINYMNSAFENSKTGFKDILKALYDERSKVIHDYMKVLRSQMKQGVIPRQAITDDNGNATRRFVGGGSLNYKWYRDMIATNGGRVPNKIALNSYLEQTAENHLSNGYVDPMYGVQVGPNEVMDYEIREAAINGLEGIAGKVEGFTAAGKVSGKNKKRGRAGKATILPGQLDQAKAIGAALYDERENNESTQTTSETGTNTEDNNQGTKYQAGDVRQSEQTSEEGKVNTAERAQKPVQNVEDPKHEEIHATDKETDHTERGSKSTDEQEQNSKKGNNTNNQKAAEAFGTSEGKKEQLADMLGLKPKKKAKVMNIVDDSDEALEVYFKEAQHKMKQVHSGIDPTLLVPLFKIGMVYVQRGVNRFADFADKVVDRLGDKARPWLRAAWETVQAYPKDLVFNEKHMNAVFTYVGARIGEGASLEEIKSDFVDAYGQEETKPFMPMFDCAYKGVQTFLNEKGDSSNVDDSTGKLAERTGGRTNKDTVGADDGRGKPSGRSKSEGLQSAGTKAGTQGSVRVRDRSAAAGREVGDSGVQKEESSNRTGSTGSSELSGSVRDSYDGSLGLDDGRKAADIKPVEKRRVDEGPVKQNKGTDKAGNLESIKNDLPMLLPAQQEDVAFAERRLDENGAQGVMFTNGTGTGKTFTGLGVIKRMVLQGKKNILVVSPTAEINKQWIDTAKEFFGLNISPLESITDIGKHGVCITTYANFQSNKELVKRNWDAVVADESHNLMNNKGGEDTGYIKMLRVLTMHPREAINRFKMLHRTKAIIQYEKANDELSKQVSNLKKQAKASHGDVMTATNITAKEKELRDKISDNTQAIYDIYASMAPERKAFEKQMQEMPADARPKAIFLSATPFAYDKDVDYAEGYLFNYDADNNSGRYNHADGRDKFMIQNFGYRMRNNKLTRPEAEVDNRVMEVSFHDKLVDSGAISGRQIDVDKDYDRGFLLVDGGIGKTIDDGFTWLRDSKKYRELSDVLFNQFKNRERKYLLESIKAKAAIPFIQKYAQSGKKVVLFHQAMVEKRNVHPFKLKSMFSTQSDDERVRIMRQYESFKHERPDLIKLNLNALPSPMETLKNELGKHAVYVDGQTSKKDRAAAIKLFNSDKSGMNVIVVQQDAGNAGISLHDTTGKHPRVLINIAMPERPSYAMQIEGRIFRVGNASNATFRYLATGMNIEKEMFANTIGGRAATVENLAVGDEARGLHESFTDAYMETMDGTWKRRLPGHPDEGTGGKEKDMAQRAALSEYDRAKSFYFANQKKTSATKAAEGNDYFATPEPIGYKMVEWLGLKAGDRALEPSAGHGAISRWFNPNTQNTIVEPSAQLAPLAQMVTPESKVIHSRFEDFNIINKFDGIAMNPPFGSGGKTAVEHIAKAYRQLADGGRMVAIMPDGPAANKHFNKWFYGTDDANGEVIDAAPKGAVLTATIRMPGVMFGRAGTGVATKILVIDKQMDTGTREIAEQEAGIDMDLHDVTRINDLFDRVENMTMPERIANHSRTENVESATDKILDEGGAAGEKEGSALGSNFIVDNYEHTKTHEMIPSAKLKDRIDNFNSLKSLVKKNGGYYSRYAKSFLFDDAVKRDQFIKEADALIGPGMLSTEGSAEDMLSKITFPDESTLSSREQNIADFGKSLGVPVVFFDGPSQLHGFHRHNITFLNRRSATSLPWTFWHETFHWLRNNNPRLYQQMVDYVRGKEAFNPEQLKAYRDDIGRPELSDAETIEEMLADTMPEVKKRVSFMKDLGKDDPSLAQSIVAWIRNIMDRFRDALCRPGVGLTPIQSEAMHNAFANLAADMVDSDGRRIFRVTGKEREIRTIQGEVLANVQLSLDNSENKGDNEGERKITNRITVHGNGDMHIILKYPPGPHETQRVRVARRKAEVREIDASLVQDGNRSAYVNLIPKKNKDMIDQIIHSGIEGSELALKYRIAYNRELANYSDSMDEKKKILNLLILKGAEYYAARNAELHHDSTGSGRFSDVDHRSNSQRNQAGTGKTKNIVMEKHSDKGAFSIGKSSEPAGSPKENLVYVNKEKALSPGRHELTLRAESEINSALSKPSIKTGTDLVNKRLDNPTKYSVSTEPAGVPKRIYHALMDLVGLGDTKLESNIEQRKAKGDKEKSLDNLNVVDMWAKSVRQVARKNEAVKFFYGLGRKAYSEQEHLRNEYAQAMRRFNAYTKNEQDNKDVSSVLWQGDAEGRDFTVKELKAMGLSDNAIRAYHVVRDNLKKAYNMVNDARMQVKVRSRTMSRNDIDDFKVAHFLSNSDILKVTPREDGRVLVTYRGAKVYEVTGAVVSEDAFKGMKGDRDIVVTNEIEIPGPDGENLYKVNYTERIKPLVNRTGYMPHFFHKFMVYEKYTGEDGKEKLVSLGSGESLKKAAALANKYAKEMPDREYVIRPHGFESDEEYNNVVVGDTNYTRMTKQIADHTEMTLSQANQFLHDSAGVSLKGRHRFFGNMQKRTGAEGWDKDMSWALAHYFNAASRYVAMEHFKPDAISMYERLFGDFNAVQRNNTAKYIKKFISDMNGNPQWIEEQLNKALEHTTLGRNLADYYNGRPALALSGNFSSFNAVTKLGLGNFASAAINFMQFINVATRLNSYKYAMRGLNAALKPNELDNKIVDASGVMDEVNLSSDAGGYTQRRDYGKARKGLAKIKQAADFSMRPFTWADTLMRKAAVIGGYYQGVEEKGMKPEDGDELSKAALNYANDVNFDANFDYSAVSTPGAIRAGSVLTQQMFQFQKYPIMQFEFLWNNVIKADNNAQRARFLVPYLLLAGAVGSIPFGDLMNQFLSYVFRLFTGKDENLADDVKAELMKWAGNDLSKRALVNTVLYGVLANIGIDVSSRVGMSNSFSGEFYGNKPEGAAGMIASVMGGPLVSTTVNVIHQAHEHNPIEAIKAISPALGNIMQAMTGETRTTHHRVGSVYTTAYDRIIHGLGFRSTDETNNSFVNSYLYDSRKQQAEDKKDAMDEYIRNPSEINRRNLNDFGITDKTFKKYKEDSEKSAKERGQQEKKVSKNSKSKKPDTEGQRNDRELKAFTK